MKTNHIIMTIAFSLSVFFVAAQTNTGRPVSKEVEKIVNRKSLDQEQALRAVSIGPSAWIVSKQVQAGSYRLAQGASAGNMVSGGYPTWTITKGVHKTISPAKNPVPVTPVIKDVIAGL